MIEKAVEVRRTAVLHDSALSNEYPNDSAASAAVPVPWTILFTCTTTLEKGGMPLRKQQATEEVENASRFIPVMRISVERLAGEQLSQKKKQSFLCQEDGTSGYVFSHN